MLKPIPEVGWDFIREKRAEFKSLDQAMQAEHPGRYRLHFAAGQVEIPHGTPFTHAFIDNLVRSLVKPPAGCEYITPSTRIYHEICHGVPSPTLTCFYAGGYLSAA